MRYVLVLALLCSGCSPLFTRTIYVPDGKMIRIRKTVKNWPVWVKDSNGVWVEGRMDVAEGWYAAAEKE
jgi:hypothetical protein